MFYHCNHKFNDYINAIFPEELEITDIIYALKWSLCQEFDEDGKLFTRLCDKHDDFDFPIVNFPYSSRNIPETPAYGVFVSQLIRCARVCSKHEGFLFMWYILGFKVILSFTETSCYVSENLFNYLTLLCRIGWRVCSPTVTYVSLSGSWRCHMWGRKCSLIPTWFHSVCGVHDFTHSLYMHYRICQSNDYVYGLMVCLPGLVGLLCLFSLLGCASLSQDCFISCYISLDTIK